MNAETYFESGTPDAVKTAIESARMSRERVRIWTGDAVTGEAWAEENDVTGRVGRSCGSQKVPLLVNNSRSMGGSAIATDCILRIVSIKSGRVLYQHPKFSAGEWAVHASEVPGYVSEARHNGTVHARFKAAGSAERFCQFMRGERFAK